MFIVNDQKITVNYRRGINILTYDIFARRHTFRVRDCEKNRLKCSQEQAKKLRMGKAQKLRKSRSIHYLQNDGYIRLWTGEFRPETRGMPFQCFDIDRLKEVIYLAFNIYHY